MMKPILLVTRKLPDAVEARAARDYDARLNLDDTHSGGVQIVRRAREVGPSGILCAPGDRFDSACINAQSPSVKIIATFSVGFDHIDIAAAKARSFKPNCSRSDFACPIQSLPPEYLDVVPLRTLGKTGKLRD